MAELETARGGRGDDTHAELVQLLWRHGGIGQRPSCCGQRELSGVVRLWDQPVGEVLLRHEAGDLTGKADRVLACVEPGDVADTRFPTQGGAPVVLGTQAVRRCHTEPGDNGVGGHRPRRSGVASTIALWNPPNPLPTVRTTSDRCSLATSGT